MPTETSPLLGRQAQGKHTWLKHLVISAANMVSGSGIRKRGSLFLEHIRIVLTLTFRLPIMSFALTISLEKRKKPLENSKYIASHHFQMKIPPHHGRLTNSLMLTSHLFYGSILQRTIICLSALTARPVNASSLDRRLILRQIFVFTTWREPHIFETPAAFAICLLTLLQTGPRCSFPR